VSAVQFCVSPPLIFLIMNLFEILITILSLLLLIILALAISFFLKKKGLENRMENLEELLEKNIEDLKRLNSINESSEKIIEIISDNIPHGLVVIDTRQKIIRINESILNIFLLEREKVLGEKTIFVFNNKKLEDLIDNAVKNREPLRDNIVFYGDEEVSLDVGVFPVNAGSYSALILFRNTTQEFEFSKLRSQFVANVSHEMRTPLTSIRGYVETVIENDLNDKDLVKKYLEKTLGEINRLNALIEDILNLSNIEFKRNILLKQSVDVVAVINDVMESLNFLVLKNGSAIFFKNSGEKIFIESDEDLFRHLVKNLIENSLFHGGVKIRIDISIMDFPDHIVIEFADNGRGIDQGNMPYIFQRFFRGDSPDRLKKTGSGLGLSIVKHIVELHDGSIKVSSIPGIETKFAVSLPKGENRG
jgi:two-component system, OmpR family, phosphate regulon sensor histidine kinase PhoR